MIVKILPSILSGHIEAPASKSSMQRACAAALLMHGVAEIINAGRSDDDIATLKIIQQLGADITHTPDGGLIIRGVNGMVSPSGQEIDCGESGLGIRMFTPVMALSDRAVRITGSGSLRKRPLDFFDVVLPQLGVSVHSNNGKIPFTVKGPLVPADIHIDGSMSSQYLTGLLLAYSVAATTDVTITVHDLKSRPYIDLTLDVMRKFGMRVPENRDYAAFYFRGEKEVMAERNISYVVESDWSGGAFLLVAGAIAGPITIRGLDLGSAQADKSILGALMAANAGIAMEAKGLKIHPASMTGFEFDATDCPDLFPPLAVLAAYCKGQTVIKGVGRLVHKESNRAQTLQAEMMKMGVPVEIKGDHMIIQGGHTIRGGTIHSHYDHRIAMAGAVAALGAEGETRIEDAEAVNKSYPGFFEDLKKLGAAVSLNPKYIIP